MLKPRWTQAVSPIWQQIKPVSIHCRHCRTLRTSSILHSSPNEDTSFTKFTHLSSTGDARMVSIASKSTTSRLATAVATIHFSSSSQTTTSELLSAAARKKGDILAVARVAGIQAAKQTSTIIPLCHNIPLSSVDVGIEVLEGRVEVTCTVECVGRTGVEMEALCGVMGAGLTVYDMCKSVDKGMRIEGVRVVEKRGGKSGDWIDGKQVPSDNKDI